MGWVKKTIKIERQLVRLCDNGVQFSQLKTLFSKRAVDLGAKVIEILHSHYGRQHDLRKAAGDYWEKHDLIFTTRSGGKIHYRNLFRDFKAMLRNVGLPEIRFHDLRHTTVSLMLNHDVPLIIVSRRLGHARPSITLDIYRHLIPSMQAEAAQKIDDLVTPVQLHLPVIRLTSLKF